MEPLDIQIGRASTQRNLAFGTSAVQGMASPGWMVPSARDGNSVTYEKQTPTAPLFEDRTGPPAAFRWENYGWLR